MGWIGIAADGGLSMTISGGASETASFLMRLDAKGVPCKELAARVASPIEFKPARGGRSAFPKRGDTLQLPLFKDEDFEASEL